MEFNQAEAREELADIWHFLIQASLELGLTPDDILKEYLSRGTYIFPPKQSIKMISDMIIFCYKNILRII